MEHISAVRHRHGELTVVGYAGKLGSRTIPCLLEPLYSVTESKTVLTPPYQDDGGWVIAGGYASEQDLLGAVSAGEATRIEPGLPARSDGCLFAPVGDGPVIYTTRTEAHKELVTFALSKQQVGDQLWMAQDVGAALDAYELAAAVSHDARDYARMLLCDVKPSRRKRLDALIRAQGGDPTSLCAEVRGALTRGDAEPQWSARPLKPMELQRQSAHRRPPIRKVA